ncbi:Arginyl-tRNA--protein transferase 1 [Platanthera guangdongensis]|uniref:Arginyl-tRNA--protein transferase n=1 Tax=Platanthera guangdongensis TaxID=2320717 RepID=A0ABR2LSF7_9ASPA
MDGGASSSRRVVGGGGSAGETVLVDHGRRRSPCGYCRSPGCTSISHGLWAQSIKADDYQDLLDRGWRRSGCFLYKPEMERTCCPSYTIRLKACDFVPSKEQTRVQKKMERFVDGMLNPRKPDHSKEVRPANGCIDSRNNHSLADSLGNTFGETLSVVKKVERQPKRKLSEDLLYTSNISFQIAALLRRAQYAQEKHSTAYLVNSNPNGGSLDIPASIIAEKLSSSIKCSEHIGLLVKACNGHLNFYSSNNQCNYLDLVSNTETFIQISEGTSDKKTESSSTHSSANIPFKKRKLEIRLKRSSFDPEEFSLYKRYQINIHGDLPDKVTESSYRRFLVDTPIIFVPPTSSSRSVPACGFGSFHQQYVIDGKLVAVGVIDILPRCLSSKYLFWDPDLSFLSLGKYSALQEINWVKDSHEQCSSLQYYYLGFYIHSCNKMRYKAAYRPSELLCPLRYEWVPFDIARPLLDKKSYVVLSDIATRPFNRSSPPLLKSSNGTSFADNNCLSIASSSEDDEAGADHEFLDEDEDNKSDTEDSDESLHGELRRFDISNILIGLHGSRLRFKDLQRVFGPIDKSVIRDLELQLERYVRVVGTDLSSHIIYSLG